MRPQSLFKETHVQDAIAFLRDNEPPEGYFLAFSGGKDSIVCHDLAEKSGVKFKAYYSCTRLDPPEIYRFIKQNYPGVTWLFPKKSFWRLLMEKGYPCRQARWCCDKIKKDPSEAIPLNNRVVGIRAEESYSRAGRGKMEQKKRARTKGSKPQTLYKPIFYWLEWMVWDYIEANGLPYPSLYDEGFGRIGCVVCPFVTGSAKVYQHKKRWPALYRVFEKVMTKKFERDLKQRPEYAHHDAQSFIQAWYAGKKIQADMVDHGQQELTDGGL